MHRVGLPSSASIGERRGPGRAPALLLITAALLNLACRSFEGEASITGTVTVTDCNDNKSRTIDKLEVDTFYAQVLSDPAVRGEIIGDPDLKRLNIRLQHGSDLFYLTDALSIQILDIEKVKARYPVGTPIPVTGADTDLVRAQLELFFQCPDTESVGLATGTLTFMEEIADDFDQRLLATFSFTLDDGPRREALSGTVTGSFDFKIRRGQPAQRFP